MSTSEESHNPLGKHQRTVNHKVKEILAIVDRAVFPPPKGGVESLAAHVWRVLPLIFGLTIITYFVHHAKVLSNFESPALDSFVRSSPITLQKTLLIDIQEKEYTELFKRQRPLQVDALLEVLNAIVAGEPAAIVVDIDTEDATYKRLREIKFPCEVIWARAAVEHSSQILQHHHSSSGGHGDAITHPFEPLGVLGENIRDEVVSGFAVTRPDNRGYLRAYPKQIPIIWTNSHGDSHDQISQEDTLPWKAIKSYQSSLQHSDDDHKESSHVADAGSISFKFSAYPESYDGYPVSLAIAQSRGNLPEWKKMLANKIVLLGATFPAAGDMHMTPRGAVSGVKLVGFAIESYLQDNYLKEPHQAVMFALDILLGILCVTMAHFLPRKLALFVVPIIFPIVVFVASFYFFDRLSVWVSFVPMLFGIYLHLLHDHLLEDREIMRELTELRKHTISHKSAEHEA